MKAFSHNDHQRVVVTGMGAIAANGIGTENFWQTLVEGRSGVGPITLFDASKLSTRIAAEATDFKPEIHLPPGTKWKRMPRQAQFALSAMKMALADAQMDERFLASVCRPVGISIGVSTSAIEVVEDAMLSVAKGQPNWVRPWVVWATQPHCVPMTLAECLGTHTEIQTISTACKAGLDAILGAMDAIRGGHADVVIAGGSDASITPSTCAAFSSSRMLSARNDDPQHASRPFDRDRDGGVLGEGAGILVLESLTHARARGARIWLELCGGASHADAAGKSAAEGLGTCMTLAMANAHVRAEDIDYVCAHAPSDPVIDRVETRMLRKTLGHHAFRIPVSSIKGVTGNPLAAAGPLELITCALAMRDDTIPPTANYTIPDPECDLDYVPQARRVRLNLALMNIHGMGGGNATLIARRYPS